ncbi:threonine--tRNA ligase [Lentilactobacillus buchneri]|uniref:Threonine--tRNA ligase n=1 Tax=Lentilactobacillus buchneri DSM 20057 TaxID=1423728 RepID=A0A4R5NUP7_LENBU|nr:threonine--tRNA ligase [Lentilactobacillus buchneri]AEB73466.1 threonyl-tRNA synthetase [Lentilactobacillus buchneri NRRL B-30929]KRK69058.1 threonyl-tRNA synthetase [Lentilactobacillus buchneri DSM 20057]MCT2898698.1 threonine--tRNA ligase [Lentilactobacillus buchneri]MCT3253192.1 threonine--tRNA ligase [Lentilactobacillus buchneri]MCT3547785.1 threonine--tRNA ligase [Lentilactobacillus buchneri]
MSQLSFEFPDGSVKQFDDGVTSEAIAKSIAVSLGKKAVAAKVDGKWVNNDEPLHKGGKIEIVTSDSDEGLSVLRATAAQILKMAIANDFDNIHFGESDADEDGFFVDTDKPDTQISVDQLSALEDSMHKIIKQDLPIKVVFLSADDAAKVAGDDPYQKELVKANEVNGQVKFFQIGDFQSIAEGAVLPSTGKVKIFKLLSVAGAYWQGKSSNPMLQRIYATAFNKQKDLDADLEKRKEAHERDHRVIGNELDLFFVDPKVGAGLPYWMPNGATIRRTIERYIVDKEVANGYQHVYTPVLANLDLYKQSGHWDHYREDMFPPMDMGDGEELELRPMNCPSHIQIYNHHIRSYRELPLRIAELGMMHRYEKSGALSGLQRVREMTLNDGHTFVALDQIQEEFKNILNLMVEVYHDFDINDYTFRLSYRDPKNTEKYFDDDEMWTRAQTMLKGAMDEMGLDYVEAEGEAAFYGPKLDVQTKTALGNEETLSTIQLDFMLPERFDLHYIGEDGKQHRPVMIHRGLVSTMERFVAYLTEIYKGAFPTWLAPHQVKIIPVSQDKHLDYAKKINDQLRALKIRSSVDTRAEKMGYLIRDAQTHKIPYTLVVGDEEVSGNSVSVRKYGEQDTQSESVPDFIDEVSKDIASYSREED